MQSKESKALRHAFFAERTAAKIPDVPDDTPTRPIRTAAILGFGTMGGGIAMSFANAGIPVTVFEKDQAALDRGLAMCRRNWEATAKKGRLTAEQVEQRVALLRPTLDFTALGNADIVIEAVYEDMVVKQDIFARLDSVMKRGAILATNTSTLDVDQIAAATSRPQDVIGTHFFSPANVMRLLEVVRGRKTAKDVLATVMQLAKRLKKVGVVSGVCDGFIGNRMLEQYIRQSLFLVDEGASPQQIDAALTKFGMAMGPFTMYDMAGMDIGYAIRQRRYVEKPHITYSRLADRVVELGRLGQKTGKGWYRYEAGNRTPVPDPEIDALIESYRTEIGLRPRSIDDEEIVQRCVYALVNEGARILDEGIALRASDIDVVYLTGYGFPVAHRRTDVPRAAGRARPGGRDDEALCHQPARRSGVLGAGPAAGRGGTDGPLAEIGDDGTHPQPPRPRVPAVRVARRRAPDAACRATPSTRARPSMRRSTPPSGSPRICSRRTPARATSTSRSSTASASRSFPRSSQALDAFVAAGLMAAEHDEAFGGMQLPLTVAKAVFAYFKGANVATERLRDAHHRQRQPAARARLASTGRRLRPSRTGGALLRHDVPVGAAGRLVAVRHHDARRIRARLAARSAVPAHRQQDVDLRRRARPVGEHRPSGAGQDPRRRTASSCPAPAESRSLSVPKRLVAVAGAGTDARVTLGERNDVVLAGLNHKMGYRGTTNCLLNFGEGKFRPEGRAGAIGYLVGEPGRGLAAMFHMMNEARIGVGPRRDDARLHRLPARARVRARTARRDDPSVRQARTRRSRRSRSSSTPTSSACCSRRRPMPKARWR